MKCPVCTRPRPLALWVTGIRYEKGIPIAIEYRCVCGEKREVLWADASREERQQAYLAEMSKWASCEMACL